jgi:hypothetical protein
MTIPVTDTTADLRAELAAVTAERDAALAREAELRQALQQCSPAHVMDYARDRWLDGPAEIIRDHHARLCGLWVATLALEAPDAALQRLQAEARAPLVTEVDRLGALVTIAARALTNAEVAEEDTLPAKAETLRREALIALVEAIPDPAGWWREHAELIGQHRGRIWTTYLETGTAQANAEARVALVAALRGIIRDVEAECGRLCAEHLLRYVHHPQCPILLADTAVEALAAVGEEV